MTVCTRPSPGAPKPQRTLSQGLRGKPSRDSRGPRARGVSSFPREPSGNEATAAVETRAVDKWLPCLNLLDYETRILTPMIYQSQEETSSSTKSTAAAASTKIQATG